MGNQTENNDDYVVCLASKYSWLKIIGLAIFSFISGGSKDPNELRLPKDYWVYILSSGKLRHVSHIGMVINPDDYLEHYCDNFKTLSRKEIEDLYFQEDATMLQNEYQQILKFKIRNSSMVRLPG